MKISLKRRFKLANIRMERIWAARLITNAPGIEPSLLLLIKEKEHWWGENSGDQVILFSYNPDMDPQGILLGKRLAEFSNIGRDPDPAVATMKGELQVGRLMALMPCSLF